MTDHYLLSDFADYVAAETQDRSNLARTIVQSWAAKRVQCLLGCPSICRLLFLIRLFQASASPLGGGSIPRIFINLYHFKIYLKFLQSLASGQITSCSTEITEFISSTSFHQKCPETLGGSALRLLWFEGWAASAKPVNMSFNIEIGGAGVQVMH